MANLVLDSPSYHIGGLILDSPINTFDANPDLTPPVILLTGPAYVKVKLGEVYTELGAIWTDDIDGTGPAIVGGDVVDENTEGVYTVTYNYTDGCGNAAPEVTRTVEVADGVEIPTDWRDSFTLVYYYLTANGFEGSYSDVIIDWLVQEGIEQDQINVMWYEYLQGLGFEGTLTDKLGKWRNE